MVKELNGFRVGDKVVLVDAAGYGYWTNRGVVENETVLTISDISRDFLYFFGAMASTTTNGWLPTRFKHYSEPDLHVYPDTPVDTILIVTEDTISRFGTPISKGTLVTLVSPAYVKHGTMRQCRGIGNDLMRGANWYPDIDCDVLMIKG